jgi:cytochrome c oxidase subunit 3
MLTKKSNQHPFHLVTSSPWPFCLSVSIFALLSSIVCFLHHYKNAGYYICLTFFFFCLILINWFNDIIFESTSQLKHTISVQKGLRLGMILFIVSEIMFFFSFFWTFFHSSISPAIQIGTVWPPKGILVLNPWEIPLLNTLILVLSGIWATLAHHILKFKIKKYYYLASFCFDFSILLGLIFTLFQIDEYITAPFTISDSIYGSIFFLATGFHGFHVLVGTLFLIIIRLRHQFSHFIVSTPVGVDAAVWYWHFVDVVWLFLFISIYWWGS